MHDWLLAAVCVGTEREVCLWEKNIQTRRKTQQTSDGVEIAESVEQPEDDDSGKD